MTKLMLKGRNEGNLSLHFNTVYTIIGPDVEEAKVKYGTPKINIMIFLYIYCLFQGTYSDLLRERL